MINKILRGAVVAGAIATASIVSASPVEAATVFDFTGPSNGNAGVPSLNFIVDGLTVTATGSTQDGDSRNVTQGSNGIGVTNGGPLDSQVDGFGPDDVLNLFFSESVRLVSATFGSSQANDEFQLLVDGAEFFGTNGESTGSGPFIFNPSPGPSESFGFTVTENNDDYFLQSLVVETIPTPALLPGLIGMGAAALRRRRQEATEA